MPDLAVDCETMASVPFARLRRSGGRLAPPGPAWNGVNVAVVAWCAVDAASDGKVSAAPATRVVRPEPGDLVDNPYSSEVTLERLRELGVPARESLGDLGAAIVAADRVVCHNADFDRGAIVSHMRRAGLGDLADEVDAKEWVCTMRRASESEPAFSRKFPKLAELVRFYGLEWPSATGEEHTAAADATACAMCHAVQAGRKCPPALTSDARL